MGMIYLFRIDGAKDNDGFFEKRRLLASVVYAGRGFCVGSERWIPDLVEVSISEQPVYCSLTIIELEATKPAALVSCRKYLPENSGEIIAAFKTYVDDIVRDCQSTADPRRAKFIDLKVLLSQAQDIRVKTAGALRSADHFAEDMPLIDQPSGIFTKPPIQQLPQGDEEKSFRGSLRLGGERAKALSRCVRVLDAVIRGKDHSDAVFRSWIAHRSQPLKRLLSNESDSHTELCKLILEVKNSGIVLDFEKLLSELAQIWSDAGAVQPDQERVRTLITGYYPKSLAIKGHDDMQAVFETAREHLSNAER